MERCSRGRPGVGRPLPQRRRCRHRPRSPHRCSGTACSSGCPGGDPSRHAHTTQVTLHEENPVVETEAVPVERVRLTTEEQTDEETVTGEAPKEKIEADTDDDMRDR
ncbi:DUF2382 domain-containing protein [Streptomyces toxytricini]|uniref:DUF2382 domain-containing protein n=1 Tax=Streptomyces toxytricini TaxID=67369 RepID=UPI00342FB6A5